VENRVLVIPDGGWYSPNVRDFYLGGGAMIKKELLDILACPKCKGKVKLNEDSTYLICDSCMLKYPIEDGIPIMLIDRAEKLE